MFAVIQNGVAVELPYGHFTTPDGIQHPRAVLDAWSDEELRAIGVYRVREEPLQDGYYLESQSLYFDGQDVFLDRIQVELPDPPPPPPKTVMSPINMRRALRAAGVLEHVKAWVASQSEEVQDSWEYATMIRRDNETLIQGATLLGMSSEMLDAMFEQYGDPV